MQFDTPAQQECYDKVAQWMFEIFGKFPCARPDVPGLGVFLGSALAEVLIFPWENDAIINTRSYVATGASLTPELMRFLLEENTKMIFGAFGIDPKGDIVFEHSIVGSTCDKNELESSVRAILEIADQYDDPIVERWGGKRALDRMMAASES